MKLYLAGPVTGKRNRNAGQFRVWANRLRSYGYEVVVPHDHVPPTASWEDAMETCLELVLDCDGIALLDGWEESKGVYEERRVAIYNCMPEKPVKEWK